MTVVALDRTTDQRRAALQKANAVRYARAALKLALRDREIDAADVVTAPASEYLTMRVADLLLAIPQYGRTKVRKVMRELLISDGKTLGGLSDRQRQALAERLGGRR